MPNPKLETYKNKATGDVYDYTDADAQGKLTAILDGTTIDSFSDVESALADKVDVVSGKGLSTNDYDDTEKAKVAGAFPRSEQAVLGAKNLFNLDASVTEVNNALYEKESSGFRVYNTTAKAYSQIRIPLNLPKNTNIKFTAHMAVTSGTGNIGIEYSDNGSDWSGLPLSGTGGDTSSGTKDYNMEGSTGNHAYYRMDIFCTRATSTTGDISVSGIMLRLATDPDDTYVPYAMTNRELTDMFVINNSVKDNLTPYSDITIDEATFARCGYICAYSFKLTATGEITAPKALITAGLTGPSPMVDMIANAVFKDTSGNQYSLSFTSTSGVYKLVTNTAIPNGTSIRGTIVFIRSV